MEFDQETTIRFQKISKQHEQAAAAAMLAARAVLISQEQLRTALEGMSHNGPNIENWRDVDAREVVSCLKACAAASETRSKKLAAQSDAMEALADILEELRSRVIAEKSSK